MDSERWKRVRAVLEEALALEPIARTGFVARACAGDGELEREVGELLAEEGREERLEPPAAERVAGALGATALGRTVGGYVLERVLGSGGMGTVYLARREVEGFTQHVALKLVRGGLDSAETLRRFKTERSVLASLQHEHIARFHDGGTTPDGQPWYAMEYVDGLAIDRWCDERRLGTRARVALFLEVCAAVQHAHGRLVVHRDLKPANILVTDGHVKLLDFGIAKLLEADEAQATLTGQRALTPAYASPEQLRGEPIGVASDVYALGVVLYELLAGARPHASPSAVVARRAPARPSTAVSAPAAATRGAVPERLARELRGDLDTILLKALHEEPSRRYATVEALAEDLRRHLAGRTVLARPDTAGYRLRTFVRRNRLAVGLAAAVLLALVGGLGGTLSMYLEARAQTTLATDRLGEVESARLAEADQRELAESRFQDVRRLAAQFLYDFHDAIADLPGVTTARERIVGTGLAYLDRLAAERGEDRELQFDVARGYQQVARIQQPRFHKAGLGQPEEALATLERARELFEELLEREPGDRAAQLRMGELLCDRYSILTTLGRVEEAEADLQRSAELLQGLADEDLDARELAVPLASTLMYRGRGAMRRGALEPARADLDAALEWARRAAGEDDPGGRRAYAVIAIRSSLADLTSAAGQRDAAMEERLALAAEMDQLVVAYPLSQSFRRASAELEQGLASGLIQGNRAAEAVAHADRCVAHLRQLASFDAADASTGRSLAAALNTAGQARHEAGRPGEARADFAAARAWLEEQHARQPEDAMVADLLGHVQCHEGLADIAAGELDAGRAHAEAGLETLTRLGAYGLRSRAAQRANLGKMLLWASQQTEASDRRLPLLEDALATLEQALDDYAELGRGAPLRASDQQTEERCRKLVARAQAELERPAPGD